MPHLFKAGRFLIEDLLSTIFFVALFAITRNLYVATGMAIAVGVLQVGWSLARRRPVDTMQWLSLGLVVVMGGASLMTHDPRFVMIKPSVVLIAVGVVMLKPGWMNRYLPPIVSETAPEAGMVFGYIWAGLMFLTAVANVVVAMTMDAKAWAWFVGTVPLASKIALFFIQYLVIRLIVRRRVIARGQMQAA